MSEERPIIELTDVVSPGEKDTEPVIELTDVVETASSGDSVIELTDVVAPPAEMTAPIELTDIVEAPVQRDTAIASADELKSTPASAPSSETPDTVDSRVEAVPEEAPEDMSLPVPDGLAMTGDNTDSIDMPAEDREGMELAEMLDAAAPPESALNEESSVTEPAENHVDMDPGEMLDTAAPFESAPDEETPVTDLSVGANEPADDRSGTHLGEILDAALPESEHQQEPSMAKSTDDADDLDDLLALPDDVQEAVGAMMDNGTQIGLDTDPNIALNEIEDELVASMGISIDGEDDDLTPEPMGGASPLSPDPPMEAPAGITASDLDAGIERVVRRLFEPKIEGIIVEIVEKAINKEMARLNTLLLDKGSDKPSDE